MIDKNGLLDILHKIDLELKNKITIVAVGGTAMTLLGLKKITKDIDFNIPSDNDYNEFERVINEIGFNIKIDYYRKNTIFSETLPMDYLKIAIKYKYNFDKIELYILNPIDIVCSKIARLSDRDIEDIKQCIKHYNIRKSQIKERAMQYEHAGSDEVFNQNLEYVLETLF